MNPLDSILKFINDSRAVGVPDRIIFEGLQIAMVEAAMRELEAHAVSKPTTKPTTKPTIGFFNSNR